MLAKGVMANLRFFGYFWKVLTESNMLKKIKRKEIIFYHGSHQTSAILNSLTLEILANVFCKQMLFNRI